MSITEKVFSLIGRGYGRLEAPYRGVTSANIQIIVADMVL